MGLRLLLPGVPRSCAGRGSGSSDRLVACEARVLAGTSSQFNHLQTRAFTDAARLAVLQWRRAARRGTSSVPAPRPVKEFYHLTLMPSGGGSGAGARARRRSQGAWTPFSHYSRCRVSFGTPLMPGPLTDCYSLGLHRCLGGVAEGPCAGTPIGVLYVDIYTPAKQLFRLKNMQGSSAT